MYFTGFAWVVLTLVICVQYIFAIITKERYRSRGLNAVKLA